MRTLRVGVDVGGTFTDVVSCDDVTGEVRSCKVPTVPDDRAQGVLDGLRALLRPGEAGASLAHGTTTVTNAIVEGRIAPVGLVTTRGFRDVLEIARMNRAHLYRLDLPARAEPLVPRRRRLEITERVGPDGTVLTPLAPAELEGIVGALRAEGVEAVAVCLLHAYANPVHERALRRALEPHFRHVSVSSEINAEFREYERTCTTALNAAVMPLAGRYLDGLTVALGGAAGGPALRLLHSAGGMMSVAAAKARPLAMALSGPAAGVAAAAHVARALGLDRALAFDMGGTTTDVCLISDGAAETTSQRRLADYPVRLPMVAVESIGAGGGSLARVDEVGALKVGPQSAGAVPGPACYGQGGTLPTVTDANLVLGHLNPARLYGGSIRLDPDGARRAVETVGRRLGLSTLEAAHGIVEVANASMLRALRLVSVQRGHDLRRFSLIAYGGAGPVHAGALARQCGIRRVVVPAHSGAFSALGCLVSPLRYDAVQTHRARLDGWDGKLIEDRFRALEEQCLRPILEEGHAAADVTLARSMDLRYVGQNYEIELPWERDPAGLRPAFEARHRQLYGYATGEGVECVNLRVVARLGGAPFAPHPGPLPFGARETSNRPILGGERELSNRPAFAGEREPAHPLPQRGRGQGEGANPVGSRAYFPETGEVALPRHDRAALAAGVVVAGPAVIEDEWSTIVVHPGHRAAADAQGHVVIDLEGAP
ncbi:MAG: hydantoinase/oxoprolinase family protein [Candidatus Rokuibacteriota bacterium]